MYYNINLMSVIFNKCNCLNVSNDDIQNLHGFKKKIILGSFLPLCETCLKNKSINFEYNIIIDKDDISIHEISELILMTKFIIKKIQIRNTEKINAMIKNFSNDILIKWIQSISSKESKKEKIRIVAQKIDNQLADVWKLANHEHKLPCNINIKILNSNTKEELYNTIWSYQFCEIYFQ